MAGAPVCFRPMIFMRREGKEGSYNAGRRRGVQEEASTLLLEYDRDARCVPTIFMRQAGAKLLHGGSRI